MIIKITLDKEKTKSLLRLIGERKKIIETGVLKNFPTQQTEIYYEIIKELMICILNLNGIKTIGRNANKETINEIKKMNVLSQEEIFIVDDLRLKRNKSSYEGKAIEKSFIENKQTKLNLIITKLERTLNTH